MDLDKGELHARQEGSYQQNAFDCFSGFVMHGGQRYASPAGKCS